MIPIIVRFVGPVICPETRARTTAQAKVICTASLVMPENLGLLALGLPAVSDVRAYSESPIISMCISEWSISLDTRVDEQYRPLLLLPDKPEVRANDFILLLD